MRTIHFCKLQSELVASDDAFLTYFRCHSQGTNQNEPMSVVVRVRGKDGAVQEHPIGNLVANGATRFLENQPGRLAQICSLKVPHNAEDCSFVHLKSQNAPIVQQVSPPAKRQQTFAEIQQERRQLHEKRRQEQEVIPAAERMALERLRDVERPLGAAPRFTRSQPLSDHRSDESTCQLCDGRVADPQSMYVCVCGQNACRACLSNYITVTWYAQNQGKTENRQLRCMNPSCTAGPLTPDVVALFANRPAVAVYTNFMIRLTKSETFAEAQQILEKHLGDSTAASVELLMRQFQFSIGKGKMCPRCRYGPMDFFGCDDLAAHHGQQIGTAAISNACPRCKFFAKAVDEWEEWDGIFHSGNENSASNTNDE